MTGPPTDYSTDEESALAGALAAAMPAAGQPVSGATVTTTAQFEWAGEIANNGRGGVRPVRLDGINLDPVRAAVNQYRAAQSAAATAQPYRSYQAKSWQAQLRQLTGSPAGYGALAGQGVNVTKKTLMGWLAEDHPPSAANRARISAAYAEARQSPVTRGRTAVATAAHNVAEAFNRAVDSPHPAGVRIRDIVNMTIDPGR